MSPPLPARRIATAQEPQPVPFDWPSARDLEELFRRHYGDPREHGWRVRMRRRFGYFSPDEWYEAVVDRLVTPGCRWVDVGGGHSIFPQNVALSTELAARAGLLVGVDPSENVFANRFVHRQVRSVIEDFESDEPFDLATFRMVAEHVQQPRVVVKKLAALIRPGGHVVIYTPDRWAPSAVIASIVPDRFHRVFTGALSSMAAADVFPTFYRMNTRKTLAALFADGGFGEVGFQHLDNCRTFQRIRAGCFLELSAWRLVVRLGGRYLENDLLGVYRRN